MPDLPIRFVAITNSETPARAPRGVSEELWFLKKGSFTGGREKWMENGDVGNHWERAFKYEGIRWVSG
jgi:hypothetical protein